MSEKITYTTTASSEDFHRDFEAAIEEVRRDFGRLVRNSIDGEPSAGGRARDVRSPIDTRQLVGRVEQASAEEAARAVERAHAAFPRWRDLGWERRVELLRRAAELIAERRLRLAAVMTWEVGKTRLEAMGEVEESADLLRYYCASMEAHDGFRRPLRRMHPAESTESVLLPYGVFGVIAPFNFPSALAAGMMAGALVAGNTVVFKPSNEAPLCGFELCSALWDAGVPRDVLHFVAGAGGEVGEAILHHRRTAGMAFTGSYDIGMRIFRNFSDEYPKPVVIEMGGKNPTIVTASADLEAAAEGVARSAFGFGGQKCSACSRVYVAEEVAAPFTELLLARTRALAVGSPLERGSFVGPLIAAAKVGEYEDYLERIREEGGEVLCGGEVLRDGDLAYGHYVAPTVVRLADRDSELFHEEMFLPILLVARVRDLDEALELANRAPYGLTAGLFSSDRAEVDRFLAAIESGVLYVNRRSGATTGAWPGINPFGGWKASGSTGPAALGPYYLLKFLREQSRTVNGFEPADGR